MKDETISLLLVWNGVAGSVNLSHMADLFSILKISYPLAESSHSILASLYIAVSHDMPPSRVKNRYATENCGPKKKQDRLADS